MTIMSTSHFEHLDFGPLEILLQEPDISEILVNGMHGVYVERRGKLEARPDIQFKSDEHIVHIMQQIATAAGRTLSAQTPIVDVRLPDESRINLVIAPVAVDGPLMTIRKIRGNPLTLENLLSFGSLDDKLVEFFKAVFSARLNVVISGGTGSGKTTLQNVLIGLIAADERIVVAEPILELQLRNPHVVRLEGVAPDNNGKRGINILDLLHNARKMRPDRIVTSTVSGPEVWEMLNIMTDGYDGSVFAIHAENAQDAIQRIEMMSTIATNLPLLQIRSRIAQAVSLIVQQSLRHGKRRVMSVTALQGIQNNVIQTVELMRFEQDGIDEQGHSFGRFVWTGNVPDFADQLDLPSGFFSS